MTRINSRLAAALFCTGLALFGMPDGKAAKVTTAGQATQASLLKLTPGMSLADLSGRPDSTRVSMPGGRTIQLGKLRRISELSLKVKQAKATPMPKALTLKPAQTGLRINNSQDLTSALKRPDTETLQLPSGKRITVAMLRYLQPLLEKRLGHKLTNSAMAPKRTGQSIKITAATDKADWKEILQKPDSTVLESPNGKRITVGELKQVLKKELSQKPQSPSSAPAKH